MMVPGDEICVTKCRELFGEFVTDAAGTAGDQDRIALEFHNYIPPKLWDHRQSCEEALRRSTQTQRPPDARRDRASLGLRRSRHVIDRPSAHAGERADPDRPCGLGQKKAGPTCPRPSTTDQASHT